MLESNNFCKNSRDNLKILVNVFRKQKMGFTTVHINAQSLLKNMDEFRYIFENSGINVIAISETWFDKNMPDSLFKVKDYKLFRADRISHAEGVAIYVRNI